jgi:hypothetical protein
MPPGLQLFAWPGIVVDAANQIEDCSEIAG